MKLKLILSIFALFGSLCVVSAQDEDTMEIPLEELQDDEFNDTFDDEEEVEEYKEEFEEIGDVDDIDLDDEDDDEGDDF